MASKQKKKVRRQQQTATEVRGTLSGFGSLQQPHLKIERQGQAQFKTNPG